jgi:pimeloyl-ACP methyl ester carboxylesterase
MLKKIGIAVVVLLAAGGALLLAWYQVDGQPLPEAAGYLQGPGYSAAVEDDGALVFTPASPNGHGLMIMHGALIKPLSYAKTAAYFAGLGYTVYVPSGALRLSINAVDAAAARMDSFGVEDWVMIGHSMGGFSGLELITRHAPKVRALALWACAMPGDYRDVKLPMLFIRGDRDGLLPPERFADAQSKLPAEVRYVNLPGGNHQGFALYSHQFFDSPALISADRQIDFADQRTAAFFAGILFP